MKQDSENEEEKQIKMKIQKMKAEKSMEKEIKPSISTTIPKHQSSIAPTHSSTASSVSSVQV